MSYVKQLMDRIVAREEAPNEVCVALTADGLWYFSIQWEGLTTPIRYPRASTEKEAFEAALNCVLDRFATRGSPR